MRVEKEEINKKLESAQAYLEEVQKLVQIQKQKNQKLLQLTQGKFNQFEDSLNQLNLKDQFDFMDKMQLLQKENEHLRKTIDNLEVQENMCQICLKRLDQCQSDPID